MSVLIFQEGLRLVGLRGDMGHRELPPVHGRRHRSGVLRRQPEDDIKIPIA
jgi:hypothetical protein